MNIKLSIPVDYVDSEKNAWKIQEIQILKKKDMSMTTIRLCTSHHMYFV